MSGKNCVSREYVRLYLKGVEMIKINSKNDFEKITSHPRYYAVLSYFCNIECNYKHLDEYEVFINALKIRNRKKRIVYLYEQACRRVDDYNSKRGVVCSFTDNRCSDNPQKGKVNGCCCHCIYQTAKGCPSENLTCKLYFCDKLRDKNPATIEDIPELRLFSFRQRYIICNNYFCKKEKFIQLLIYDSMLIFFLYSIQKPFDMSKAEIINRSIENNLKKQ